MGWGETSWRQEGQVGSCFGRSGSNCEPGLRPCMGQREWDALQKELGGGISRVGTLQVEDGGQRSLACGAISLGCSTQGGACCV